MKINLLIYSIPIFFSSITGIGLVAYEAFYIATKSFFYGQNVTSIAGFTLCIYYSYLLKTGKINYLYYSLAFLALFLSGGKIILTVPLLTLLIYLYTGNKSKLNKIFISFSLLVVSLIFISGAINPRVFINNSFTKKYFTRAFSIEALTDHYKRERINILPLRLYSYASISRAFRANNAINQLLREPENIFFGYGVYDSQNYGKIYTVEMDIINIFYYYGIIGFLLIYIPIFKIIFPLIKRRNLSKNTTIIFTLFIYSSLAGHVLAAPMAGSLFALFLALGSNSKSEKISHFNTLAHNRLVLAK